MTVSLTARPATRERLVRDPHSMDYHPKIWPESPRIVLQCTLPASNGPNHLGLCALQSWTSFAATSSRQRWLVARVVGRMHQRLAGMAWSRWRQFKRQRQVVRRSCMRLQHRTMISSLDTWRRAARIAGAAERNAARGVESQLNRGHLQRQQESAVLIIGRLL